MTLYRAISVAEMDDVLRCKQLRTSAGSMEGKWFAESAAAAAAWGEILYGPAPHFVIVVAVATSLAERLFRLDRLDNIGPARFAEIDELVHLTFVGVVN